VGFDWGSFCGGAIGTVGAFLAARYTIKKQWEKEQPKVDKDRYTVATKISRTIDMTSWKLVNELDRTSSELMNIVISLIRELDEILPDAIEVDRALVRVIESTKEELSVFNRETWPNLPREMKDSSEYTMRTNKILHDKIQECMKITRDIIDDRKAP
jgi:gas vesicle protein